MTVEEQHSSARVVPHLLVVVRDVMTADPVTVEPTATVKDIAHVMLARDIRCVPVVDIGEQLIGVVSEADLISREGYPTVRSHHLAGIIDAAVAEHRHHWTGRAEGLTAGEIMTTDIVSCAPSEPVAVVTRRMLRHDVRTLPVVQDGRLVGVVSRHDVLRLFDRPDPEIRQRVAEVLASPLWAPEEHHVEASVLDGVVTLTGSVRYHSDVSAISGVIRHVPGVIEVVSRVTAQGPDPEVRLLHDTDWQ